MLGFQGGVSIPLVKGGVKAPPAKRQCRAGPKAGARRGFTLGIFSAKIESVISASVWFSSYYTQTIEIHGFTKCLKFKELEQ